MVLASEGQQPQEAVVWLAPFKELPLQDPQLNLSGVQLTPAEPGLKVTGSDTVSAHRQQALSLTVSSKAVAVYAVLETQGPAAAGHFSDNAFTVHPCEPRQVSFKPGQAGRREWQPAADRPAAAVSSNDGGSSGDSRSGGSSGSGSKSGSSSSCGDGSRSGSSSGDSSSEDSSGSTGNVTEAGSRAGVAPEQDRVLLQANSQLGELLQEQLVVSSLWDHQQFDQPLQQQPGHKKMTDL
jgi:hypothetical protein